MTINIVVGIVCSEVANTENLTDGSITDDLTAWDLDYSPKQRINTICKQKVLN